MYAALSHGAGDAVRAIGLTPARTALISPPSFLAYDEYGDRPTIRAALLARGRSRDDVVKALGGNYRRVFGDVTAV